MFGTTRPATCFPNGNLAGCSWDVDLINRMGAALAVECQSFGVHLLLGPGINTRRTPLAGRAYEYYSEDPVISGDLAAALIRGLQDNGVGASLKHFACNNSEIDRTNISSDVDDRALREIYLAGFERAIAKSDPRTVMSAYNPLNGVQSAESPKLLTKVLREEWKYQGLVVSDWHAIKNRPAALLAGTDLDMPESPPRQARLRAAVVAGDVPVEVLDQACLRMLRLVQKVVAGAKPAPVDLEAHHALARKIALESIVLLRNEGAVLPLKAAGLRLLVVGDAAVKPVIQGSGSATTNPFRVDSPLDEIRARCGAGAVVDHLRFPNDPASQLAILQTAQRVDAVLVCATHRAGRDSEGNDRDTLQLGEGQDALIHALAKAGHKVIVALSIPDAVEMPWAGDVAAILACLYPGQGGGAALAGILFGEHSPCGKLSVSFPKAIGDIPGFHSYPGEYGHRAYSEGILVGYRSYDLRRMDVLFPFGHGLGYTSIRYDGLTVAGSPSSTVTAQFTLQNVGAVAGKEIVQLYIRPINPGLRRPVRELKAFAKVALGSGEAQTVTLTLTPRDFQYFDPGEQRFVLRAEAFVIEVAGSSRDIRLEANLPCISDPPALPWLTTSLPPAEVFTDPRAYEALVVFISTRLNVDRSQAMVILDSVSGSFLGIYDALSWHIGDSLPEVAMQALFDQMNQGQSQPQS